VKSAGLLPPTGRNNFKIINGKVPGALAQVEDNACVAFIADPPYCAGVTRQAKTKLSGYKYSTRKDFDRANDRRGGVWGFGGDSKSDRVNRIFTADWLDEMHRICGQNAQGFIFTNWQGITLLEEARGYAGYYIRDILVWHKNTGRSVPYGWAKRTEFILQVISETSQLESNHSPFYGGTSVLDYAIVPPSKRVHQMQKPIKLLEELIKAIRGAGAIIDPFMGSGSTIIAALKSGRNAIGIECMQNMCEVAKKECRKYGCEVE